MAVTHTAFSIACAVLHITGTKCLHRELKSPARVLVQDTSPPVVMSPRQCSDQPSEQQLKAALLLSATAILERQLIRKNLTRDNYREWASAGTLSLCKLSHSLGSWLNFVPVAQGKPSPKWFLNPRWCTAMYIKWDRASETSLLDSPFQWLEEIYSASQRRENKKLFIYREPQFQKVAI